MYATCLMLIHLYRKKLVVLDVQRYSAVQVQLYLQKNAETENKKKKNCAAKNWMEYCINTHSWKQWVHGKHLMIDSAATLKPWWEGAETASVDKMFQIYYQYAVYETCFYSQ